MGTFATPAPAAPAPVQGAPAPAAPVAPGSPIPVQGGAGPMRPGGEVAAHADPEHRGLGSQFSKMILAGVAAATAAGAGAGAGVVATQPQPVPGQPAAPPAPAPVPQIPGQVQQPQQIQPPVVAPAQAAPGQAPASPGQVAPAPAAPTPAAPAPAAPIQTEFVPLSPEELLAAASGQAPVPAAPAPAAPVLDPSAPAPVPAPAPGQAPIAAPQTPPPPASFSPLSIDENTQFNQLLARVLSAPAAEVNNLESAVLRGARGQRMQLAMRMVSELEGDPATNRNAIGFAPTAPDIARWNRDSNFVGRLTHTYNTGTPEAATEFWQLLLSANPEAEFTRNPQAVEIINVLPEMAARSPRIMQTLAPAFQEPLIAEMHSFVQNLADGAEGSDARNAKEAMIWALNAINANVLRRPEIAREAFYSRQPLLPSRVGPGAGAGTGARPAGAQPGQPGAQPGQPAPTDELARLRAENARLRGVDIQTRVDQVGAQIGQAQSNQVIAVVDRALGALRASLDPQIYHLAQQEFLRYLEDGVTKLPAWTTFDRDFQSVLHQHAPSGRIPPAVQQQLLLRHGQLVQGVVSRIQEGFVRHYLRPGQAGATGSPASPGSQASGSAAPPQFQPPPQTAGFSQAPGQRGPASNGPAFAQPVQTPPAQQPAGPQLRHASTASRFSQFIRQGTTPAG